MVASKTTLSKKVNARKPVLVRHCKEVANMRAAVYQFEIKIVRRPLIFIRDCVLGSLDEFPRVIVGNAIMRELRTPKSRWEGQGLKPYYQFDHWDQLSIEMKSENQAECSDPKKQYR
jgi:hypothetical protein